MQGYWGVGRPVERPGALRLAIQAWQRQLIEMAETAKYQATPTPAAGDDWLPDGDLFGVT